MYLRTVCGDIDWHCVVPENIHTPPMEGFLFCTLSPPKKFQFSCFYFASKILAFKTSPSRNFQWPSMGWVWIFSGTTHFENLSGRHHHWESSEMTQTPQTVLLRATIMRVIIIYQLMIWFLGSNHLQCDSVFYLSQILWFSRTRGSLRFICFVCKAIHVISLPCQVCYVIDKLADEALKAKKFAWQR